MNRTQQALIRQRILKGEQHVVRPIKKSEATETIASILAENLGLPPDTVLMEPTTPKETLMKTTVRKDHDRPATAGEVAADTAAQAAKRALIAEQRALEREITVQYSLFHSMAYAGNRAKQAQISQYIDELEARLYALRQELAADGASDAADDRVAKTDRARGKDALDAVMHDPRSTVKKDEALPDVFSNSMGLMNPPK